MALVRRTPTSRRDYADIWDYVADHASADIADSLLRTFDAKIAFLSDNPGAGPARPELRPNLRSFPIGSYIIFYRPIHNGIELIRVIHGARNLRRQFPRK